MFNLFKKKYTNKRELEIDIFFRHVNWYKLLVIIWEMYPSFRAANDPIAELKRNQNQIKKIWLNNPEMSIGQVLDSLGLFAGSSKLKNINSYRNCQWYNDQPEDILDKLVILDRERIIWCSRYNIFGKERKVPVYMLVKDMSTNHIRIILKSQYVRISNRYAHIFKNELTKRGKKSW